MRRLLYIITLFIVLGTAISCNRSVDKRLVLADSLMWVNPDSSLAILERINRDSLQGDENQAYYALLLTQAEFRVDYAIPSDSLISIAIDHYCDNHNREHYTRALLYKGGYYEVHNNPVEAIKWYKKAEGNADTADYRNLAQINLRLGNLYYNNFASNNLDLEKNKEALRYYEKLDDKKMILVSLLNTANSLRTTDSKSANELYNRAELLAQELTDSNHLYLVYINHSVLCQKDSLFNEAKDYSIKAWNISGRFKENCDYYILGDIYARLGDLDSAEYYLKLPIINDNTAYDNVVRYKCIMDIELAKNNMSEYHRINKLYEHIVDSLEHNKNKYLLLEEEAKFDKSESLNKKNKISILKNWVTWIAVTLCAIFIIFTVLYLVKKHNTKKLIEELKRENFPHYEELRRNLADFDNHFSKTMNEKLKSLEEIMTGAYNPNQDSKSKEVEHKISPIADDDTKFWEGLYSYINIKHNGAMDKIANDYPQLSASDLNFIKLMCCGFSDAAIAVCRNYRNVASVRSRKNKIKDKMGIDETLASYLKHIIE